MPPRNFVDTGGAPRIRTRLDPTMAKKKPVADIIYYEAPSHATKFKLALARQQATDSSFHAQINKVAQQPATRKRDEKKGFMDEARMNEKALGELAKQLAAYTPLKPIKSWMLEKREKDDPTGIWCWQEAFLPISRRKFKCFGRLPTELRLLIWKHARPGPRVVRLAWSKQDPEFPDYLRHLEKEEVANSLYGGGYRANYSKTRIPSVLHACTESRKVALGWYKLALEPHLAAPRIYFDFSADYIYAGCDECSGGLCGKCEILINDLDRWKISKILYRWPWDHDPFFDLFLHFRGVKEVLLFDAPSTGLVPSDIQLHNLKESTKHFEWQEGKMLYDVFLAEKDTLDSFVNNCRKRWTDDEEEDIAKYNTDNAGWLPTLADVFFRPEKIARVEIDFKPDLPELSKVITITNTPSAAIEGRL